MAQEAAAQVCPHQPHMPWGIPDSSCSPEFRTEEQNRKVGFLEFVLGFLFFFFLGGGVVFITIIILIFLIEIQLAYNRYSS